MNFITSRSLVIGGLISLLFQGGCSVAQEAALFRNIPEVRFEDSPGYYHYIMPCVESKDDTNQSVTAGEPALCWLVAVTHFQVVDGKIDAKTSYPREVTGTLRVSKSKVTFIPDEPSAENPRRSFASGEVHIEHEPGKENAFVATREQFYKFGLVALCNQCAAVVPPLDPAKAGQPDVEFAMIRDAIADFDASLKRYNELASHMRFGVTPGNQPGINTSPDSLKMYSDLNHHLAGMCPAPAASCIESYSKYQSCRASAAPGGCGAAPTCSAFCTLAPEEYQKLHADVRYTPMMSETSDYAWLSPRMPGAPPFGLMGAAGMGAVPGGAPAVSSPRTAGPLVVDGDVMQQQLVTQVHPVYPALAAAMHVEGAVTLHAIISKEGRVEQLQSLAGPPMLVSAAMDAAKQWKFKPYLVNGSPREVETFITLNFNLEHSPGSAPATVH